GRRAAGLGMMERTIERKAARAKTVSERRSIDELRTKFSIRSSTNYPREISSRRLHYLARWRKLVVSFLLRYVGGLVFDGSMLGFDCMTEFGLRSNSCHSHDGDGADREKFVRAVGRFLGFYCKCAADLLAIIIPADLRIIA
ncbi:hypothetical protein Dimus_008607, partial [Dionaea muscipula]